MKNKIFFLAKIFDDEKYVNDFVKGKIFANRLSYFKKLEEVEIANRGDKHEGVIAWIQPNQAQLVINGNIIDSDDLTSPLSIQMNYHDDLNVFCLYASHSGEFEQVSESNINDLKKQLEIHNDCIKLGKYVVIIKNISQFIHRIKLAAIKNNYGIQSGLIQYYDPATFNGSFSEIDAIFKKRKEYSHQNEFRFAFDTGISGKDPLILEIGDISDITSIYCTSTFNDIFELRISLQ